MEVFYDFTEESIKDALSEMGCEEQLPSDNLKDFLYSECRKQTLSGKPTLQECLSSIQAAKFKLFNDPIHGSIELHPLLAKIVNMPAFTRLKNIRQLGGVYYVYQGATHTRFEHSIGTCYIAGEFIRMLQRKQPELHISEKEVLCVEIAALCHDLGHGPFSHLFEKDVVKPLKQGEKLGADSDQYPTHEKLSTMVFEYHIYQKEESLFKNHGISTDSDVKFIKELIDHDLSKLEKPERRFLYEIVANKCTGIDVDKWDYFARDCHYMGVLTEFNWKRLMALSRVIKVDGEYRICYRDKEVNNIYGMFRTRCTLHQRAYQHQAVIATEHMIAQAILKVIDLPLIVLASRDTEISDRTNKPSSIKDALEGVLVKPTPDLEGYLALNDSIVHLILHSEGTYETEDTKIAKTLLRQLDKRMKFELIPINESDRKKLSVTKQEIIDCAPNPDMLKESDIYIRQVDISYASEGERDEKGKEKKDENGKKIKGDPVKVTYFYTKEEPWKAIKGDDPEMLKKRSDLTYPVAFTLNETRLYSSPLKKKEVAEAYHIATGKKYGTGKTPSESPRATEQTAPSILEHGPEDTPGSSSSISDKDSQTKVKRKLSFTKKDQGSPKKKQT